jgi:hypothetical protein
MGANASGEWGIFQDDGMIDGGFMSRAAAQRALDLDYAEDDAHVAEICSEHPEHEAESCELCIAIEASD